MSKSKNEITILLELGDIIEINAPDNTIINNVNFWIDYIDDNKINIISLSDYSNYELRFNNKGYFTDETIESISILSRSSEKGYARQNNLIEKTWIQIYLSGDVPDIITGEITNLEDDMIEITTYPDLDILFIDFAYKGIPENIPIQSIIITNKPSSLNNIKSLSQIKSNIEDGTLDEIPEEEPAIIEMLDTGESIITIPEDVEVDSNINDDLSKMYIESDNIVIGKKLDRGVKMLIEVPEDEQRYDITTQTNDLLDKLLSTVPNYKRTKKTESNIHKFITRFKELRHESSKFDDNNNIYDIYFKDPFYKPLVNSLNKFDKKLSWIIPIVSLKKKIYVTDDFIAHDVENENIDYSQDTLFELLDKYYKQKQHNIDYRSLLNAIDYSLTPFKSPDDDMLNILTSKLINEPVEALVENHQNLNSSVVNKNKVIQKQFVTQRYIKGTHYLKETYINNNSKYEKVQISPNDNMHIKSFLTLPNSVIDFTKLHLKSSNILNRAVFNQNYLCLFRLLNKNLDIHINEINNLNTEIEYKTTKSITNDNVDILKNVNLFSISEENLNNNYNSFIECIVPKTITLLRIYKKHINKYYSFNEVIDQLESFQVYKDDIIFTSNNESDNNSYNEVKKIIQNNIKNLREEYTKKSVLFNKLRSSIKNNEYNDKISNILKDDEELFEQYNTNYYIKKELSESEILNKLYTDDCGLLFNSMLSTHMNVLNTPKNLISVLERTDIDTNDDDNNYEDCSKRYLAKKYSSIDEIHNDNDKDTFFDKEYDDSPYHLLKNYENEMKNMSKEDFIDFLSDNLKAKHNINENNSLNIANILYSKKKPVEEDHYALVEIVPTLIDQQKIGDVDVESVIKSKKMYYKRVKNVWVKDDSITDVAFYDNNTLFCNVSTECFKNTTTNVCENVDDTTTRIQEMRKKSLIDEFDNRYTINADELQKENLKRVNYYNNILHFKNIFKDIQLQKHNNLSLLLGSLANTEPVIKSPYSDTLNKILSDNDFISRNENIIKFSDLYTRESGDDKWWLYCKDTNVKLLPKFKLELAVAFCIEDNYISKLNYIKSTQGEIDGKYVYCRYTKRIIDLADDIDEDLYTDTGHKIINHSLLENDRGILTTNNTELPEIFENENAKKINNVFNALAKNIGIKPENFKETVLQLSTTLIQENVLSKKKYDKKAKLKKEKTGKDSALYDDYVNETIVIIVSSCLLIYIQCSCDVNIKKTFPGCVKSFSGYPLTGIENLSGIKYIACVLTKIKSSFDPWNSIKKYNENILINRIKSIISDKIVNRPDIIELIREKKEYLILNIDKEPYEDISVDKWIHFLPPLMDINLPKSINNITPQFKNELYQNILKSRFNQFDMINAIISKNMKFGLFTIQAINNLVKNEPLLLKTVTLIPYVDNACCNENIKNIKVLDYFKEKDEAISQSIKAVTSNAELLDNIKLLTKAPLLIHRDKFISLYPDIIQNFSEEIIYITFIYYGRYDTIYDVPLKYKNIIDEKPEGYDINHNIEEKIVFLKKNGRKFTKNGLLTLLNAINKDNKIDLKEKLKFSIIEPLKDFIHLLETKNSTVINSILRKNLLNVLNNYKPDKYYLELNGDIKKLKNYILTVNKEILTQILDFMYTYGSLKDNQFNKIKQHLFNITHWKLDTDNDSYYDNGISNILTFIKNSIYDFCKFYPNIILNGSKNNTVHKHWGLSDKHNNDVLTIIEDYFTNINSYIKDQSLNKIIEMATSNISDLYTFIRLLPINSPYKDNENIYYTLFDKETILELNKYCLFSCIYEYILLCDNEEIFNSNIEYNKVLINNKRKNTNTDGVNYNESTFDNDYLVEEIEITTEKVQDIKKKVSELLYSFISIDMDNKNIIDKSYNDTFKRMKNEKKQEKDNIVESMGDLYKPERNVENLLKQYRLEKWDLANQKGFSTYDGNAYDNDTMRNIFRNNIQGEEETHFIIDTDNGITEDVDLDEEVNYQGRDYDISHLGEDFYDGHDGIHSQDYEDDF